MADECCWMGRPRNLWASFCIYIPQPVPWSIIQEPRICRWDDGAIKSWSAKNRDSSTTNAVFRQSFNWVKKSCAKFPPHPNVKKCSKVVMCFAELGANPKQLQVAPQSINQYTTSFQRLWLWLALGFFVFAKSGNCALPTTMYVALYFDWLALIHCLTDSVTMPEPRHPAL